MLVMYDSIDISQIPADATAVAGYIDGRWPTFTALTQRFPHAHWLPIAVTADADAEVLDVESGDATPGQASGWIKRQLARKVYRPVIYANASTMPGVLQALGAAGIPRASVRLWSAHYTEAHICGPSSCRYPGVPACDGTQWTPNALGLDLDESLLLADFFASGPKPPKPARRKGSPMLMNQGMGAITPFSVPAGAKNLILTPTDTATVAVQTHDHGTQTLNLKWQPPGGEIVPIPGGVQFLHLHRGDAGLGDVSVEWE